MLRTLGTIERQIEGSDSRARYIMRIMPYRTVDNVIDGVVITFVDISRITAAEVRIDELTHDLRNRVARLETLLNLLPVGISIIEDNRTGRVSINRYGAQLLGEGAGEIGSAGLGARPRHRACYQGGRELRPTSIRCYRAIHSGRPSAPPRAR